MASSFKSILVPTDFSDSAIKALNYARSLAEMCQATLHVLHVVEKPHLAVGGSEVLSFWAPELVQRLVRTAESKLAGLALEVEQALTVESAARVGVPHAEIVRYADENHIDMIVMGTHGRGAVGHMLLGSVAERVMRSASCPVMTLRHQNHDVFLL